MLESGGYFNEPAIFFRKTHCISSQLLYAVAMLSVEGFVTVRSNSACSISVL